MTRPGTLALCALLALTGVLFNCESIVARSGIQCSSTAECRARGGPFATSRCSSDGFCEAIVAPEAGAAVGSACSTSDECRARLDEPARCVDSTCRPLTLPASACSLIGPVENDDVALLGALVPQGGAAATEYGRAHDALRWLVSEWNGRAQQAGDRTKDVAIVQCDESRLATTLPHLLALRPKAIIGPFTSSTFREYIKGEATEIPTFAPTVDDPLLVEQPDSRRRVYSCVPNLVTAVKPFQRAAAVVAARVAAERESSAAKVVLVKTSDEAEQAFVAAVEQGLELNGQPAAGQATYKAVSMTTAIHDNGAPPLLASAQTVALEKPDVVILSAGIVAEELITDIDTRWPALNPTIPLPVFLLLGRYAKLEESFATNKKSTKGRFYALDWTGNATTADNYATVVGELLARNALAGPAAARTLDCGFLAIYGALAGASGANTSMLSVSTQQYLDGVALATTGSDENTINLKADTIPKAISLLGAVPPIKTKLAGTINPAIVFAPNGTLAGTAGLYCISSETSTSPRVWTPTGMTFGETGVENGSIACP